MRTAETLPELRFFMAQAMPSMFRRLRCWKGLDPKLHADLVEDLRQDLVLDYLENAELIKAMDVRERHGRWFRLLENRHYHLRMRPQRHLEPRAELDALVGPDRGELLEPLPPAEQEIARSILASSCHLKNGRLNAEATGRRLGLRPKQVRALWSRLADSLGYGEDFLCFWRLRLVEALVGYAADLLRDEGRVRLCNDPPRSRPDPRGKLRRIRRIRSRLGCRPLPADLRSVLAKCGRHGPGHRLKAGEALALARHLAPHSVLVQLWCFEHAIATGNADAAMRAIRAARQGGAETVPVLLARARLLEARGRTAWARRLLARAARASHGAHRLRTALDALQTPVSCGG